jgi:hypothetical protein
MSDIESPPYHCSDWWLLLYKGKKTVTKDRGCNDTLLFDHTVAGAVHVQLPLYVKKIFSSRDALAMKCPVDMPFIALFLQPTSRYPPRSKKTAGNSRTHGPDMASYAWGRLCKPVPPELAREWSNAAD